MHKSNFPLELYRLFLTNVGMHGHTSAKRREVAHGRGRQQLSYLHLSVEPASMSVKDIEAKIAANAARLKDLSGPENARCRRARDTVGCRPCRPTIHPLHPFVPVLGIVIHCYMLTNRSNQLIGYL
jgi:hypothetical protein